MAAKTTDWRPGPTVCRCCLSEGCYKDISTEYFWMGKREVYSEMLSDTFSLSIAYSTSGGPNSNSRLICEPCISRLRDASEFKRQVQECEKTFMQYLDPGSEPLSDFDDAVRVEAPMGAIDTQVKVEPVKLEKDEDSDAGDFEGRADFLDDDDDDLDDQPLTRLATKVPKKESVDLLELLDTGKTAEKRKSSTKAKAGPAKKAKTKKEVVKATSSKATKQTDKKKKGRPGQTVIKVEEMENIPNQLENSAVDKRRYRRSARAEARIIIKKNATAILECWSACPFRWKQNRFKCAYCEANFTECNSLREHVRLCASRHTVKDIYSKFKEMPLINIDIVEARCSICTAPLTDVKQIREHVVQHGYTFDFNHPDGVLPFALDKESWTCVICQEKFNYFLKLYEHMNVHYQHYICATCGKSFMTATRLRKHSDIHTSGSFPCNECGRIFTMRAARDSHKARAHAKGPRYGCPHCSLRFEGYYERMAHLNEAHREKKVLYNCSHCELSFKTSGKRAMHVKSVHFPPQRDYGCPYCEWQFKTSYELKRHMVRHTGEKNFHCNVCGKAFPRNRALTTHLKTHEEFGCKWCATVFKQRSQLLTHVRTNHPQLGDLAIPDSLKI